MGTRRPLHRLGCSSLAFPALIPAGTGLTQAPTATRAGTTQPGAEHPSCSAQQLHRTPGASPQHKRANCFASAFPQLQLAHSCISFYSSASFFFLFCRCLKKRRLFLITVLRSINERQQCANERGLRHVDTMRLHGSGKVSGGIVFYPQAAPWRLGDGEGLERQTAVENLGFSQAKCPTL